MTQHTIQALQSELDSLRADNIKLFEKIKFLQSYPGRVSALPSFRPRRSGAEGMGLVTYWVALGLGAPKSPMAPSPASAGESPIQCGPNGPLLIRTSQESCTKRQGSQAQA